jgi:hypothetical protein
VSALDLASTRTGGSSSTARTDENRWHGSDTATLTNRQTTATAAASQLSTIAPTVFSGVGQASMFLVSPAIPADHGYALATSSYQITFDLTSPYRYSWDALVSVEHSNSGAAIADALLFQTIFDPIAGGTQLQSFGRGSNALAARTTSFGLLDPGRYLVAAYARASGSPAFPGDSFSAGTFDFSLALTPVAPVPEPATVALIAGGMAALAMRRRRGARKRD